MRILLALVFLSGCAAHAAELSKPPRGEEVFGALFRNADIDLKTEPLCKADSKLYDQLALAFSVSHASRNKTTVKSSCEPSKFENTPARVIDVWECTVQINENNQSGEYVSSATFVYDLSLDKKEFLKGSLRCR